MYQFYYGGEVPENDYVYDIETYPNTFTLRVYRPSRFEYKRYEISDRMNQYNEITALLYHINHTGGRMVGYNNIGFDYPVLHHLVKSGPYLTVQSIYEKAMAIIKGDPFAHTIWPNDWIAKQLDLYKIRHYDNASRRTSLKYLEATMFMDTIEDLPFDVGLMLDDNQKEVLHDYNKHDVWATTLLYYQTLEMIKAREQMSERFGMDAMNYNDTKIGKQYFINYLEELFPGSCYEYTPRRKPRQTVRDQIALSDVIIPTIRFERDEFKRVHTWLMSQVITETKGVFTDLSCTVDGFTFDFGTGGIHGSIEDEAVFTTEDYIVVDWDVASYYPNLAIANDFYPAHLPPEFTAVYREVYEERKKYPKGSVENACYKLALNGVYGDSNNKHSPFFDPAYTMSITINGQLLLCMLAEQLMKIPSLKMIQVNTDGLTVRCPRIYQQHMNSVCQWWEQYTKLQLESAVYDKMFIRDVNNYIAQYDNGKVKRKGAYCYGPDLELHQNPSAQVVAKVAEKVLLHGDDIESAVTLHPTVLDFIIINKLPSRHVMSRVLPDGSEEKLPGRVHRYVASPQGDPIVKYMPAVGKDGTWKRANKLTDEYFNQVMMEIRNRPLTEDDELDADNVPHDPRIHTKNKSKYDERRSMVLSGRRAVTCANLNSLAGVPIDYDYYIQQVKKLTRMK